MPATPRDRAESLKKLQERLASQAARTQPDSGTRSTSRTATEGANLFSQLEELTQVQFTLDKEERDANGWTLAWSKRKAFEGTVKATFIRLTTSGRYEVSYKGRRLIASGRGNTVLRAGDEVELTATDRDYIISW